jgi:hypothetical protein
LFDAFNIFDVNRNGFISVHELLHGLASIGVHTTFDECELFITRYDKNGDRRISAAEFGEAFLAFDTYYSSMVSRRPSNYVPRPIRPDDCFLPNTAYEFQAMWRTHIRCENAAEALRQRLNMNPAFNAFEGFNSLDLNDDG